MTTEYLLLTSAVLFPDLADISDTVWREIVAGVATVVTLFGVMLCWRAPRHRMSVEEGAKDGVFTEDQARRKIEFMAWFGPAVAIVGCALLAFAVLR